MATLLFLLSYAQQSMSSNFVVHLSTNLQGQNLKPRRREAKLLKGPRSLQIVSKTEGAEGQSSPSVLSGWVRRGRDPLFSGSRHPRPQHTLGHWPSGAQPDALSAANERAAGPLSLSSPQVLGQQLWFVGLTPRLPARER